ncbi:MAG: VTT domain-containing protein [Parcubacteria group bacterium]|nr:VTT domain-containing protein [Parcubacteria group bacterium]MCR4342364.1 VTT domain-containing protein [Patescibacteria group bacterium]
MIVKDKETLKNIIAIIIIIALFIIVSYLTQSYSEIIREMVILDGILGMLLYVFITVVAVVFAPVSTLPFLAIASVLWGGFISAVLSIIGWTIGSAIAFNLARKYGRPLVSKFINIKKIERFENIVPSKHVFWTIVFLRLALPVDLLSYALGLLTKIPFSVFMYATVIGLTPFAFLFAYAVELPTSYQIIAGTLSFVVIIFILKQVYKNLPPKE